MAVEEEVLLVALGFFTLAGLALVESRLEPRDERVAREGFSAEVSAASPSPSI